MENSGWRLLAKIVAYGDITAICINYILLLFVATHLAEPNPYTSPQYDFSHTSAIIFAVTSILLLLVQLRAATKLLFSTKIGKGAEEALKQARFWRNVSVVILVITLAVCILAGFISAFVVVVIWRGGAIVIVCKFMSEIQVQSGSDGQGGNGP